MQKSHIPSRVTMCLSYPLLGNQLYLISLFIQQYINSGVETPYKEL